MLRAIIAGSQSQRRRDNEKTNFIALAPSMVLSRTCRPSGSLASRASEVAPYHLDSSARQPIKRKSSTRVPSHACCDDRRFHHSGRVLQGEIGLNANAWTRRGGRREAFMAQRLRCMHASRRIDPPGIGAGPRSFGQGCMSFCSRHTSICSSSSQEED